MLYVRNPKSTNSGQFTPSVILTDDTKRDLAKGNVSLRKGQWVVDGAKSGNRGQFIDTKGKTIRVRSARAGMTFKDYQQPLA